MRMGVGTAGACAFGWKTVTYSNVNQCWKELEVSDGAVFSV
jgi:hypothetical protein